MSGPLKALVDAALGDLQPHVRALREAGWDVRVDVHMREPGRLEVIATVALPTVLLPVEAAMVKAA